MEYYQIVSSFEIQLPGRPDTRYRKKILKIDLRKDNYHLRNLSLFPYPNLPLIRFFALEKELVNEMTFLKPSA